MTSSETLLNNMNSTVPGKSVRIVSSEVNGFGYSAKELSSFVSFVSVIHLGIDASNSSKVYNLTSSRTNSVQVVQTCPQLVKRMVWLVEVAINWIRNLVPEGANVSIVGLQRNIILPNPKLTAKIPSS